MTTFEKWDELEGNVGGSKGAKRGRPTDRETIARFLTDRGLPLALLDEQPSDEPLPTTIEELRDRLVARVGRELPYLKGNALVNAMRSVEALIKTTGAAAAVEDEPLVGDVIGGIQGLSRERRDEILRRELAKLDAERVRIEEVLASV
jgi:hypothetical protein